MRLRKFVLEKLADTHQVIHVHYNNCGVVKYIDKIPIIHIYEVLSRRGCKLAD